MTKTPEAILITNVAYDWYVDSVNGLDTNTGKGASSAFQTIAKLLTVYQAGQTAALRRGSEFRETLTVPGAGCTVTAYGAGARPVLDCADTLSAGGWTPTVGQPNVYERSLTHDGNGITTWPRCWEDGVNMVRAASVVACQATAGTYFPSSDTASPFTLYIHPTGDGDPAVNGKTYEYSARSYGLLSNYDVTVTGIHTKRNLSFSGSLVIQPVAGGATLTDCAATDGCSHNCYVTPAATITNCLFQDAYYAANTSTYLVLNGNNGAGENAIISGCSFVTTAASINSAFNGALNAHRNIGGSYGTVTVTGNTFTGFRIASGTILPLNHVSTVVITDNTFTDCSSGIQNPSAGGAGFAMTIDGNTFNSTTTNINRFVLLINVVGPVTITENTFNINHVTDTGHIYITAAVTAIIQRNVFKSSLAAGLRVPIYCSSAGANLTIGGSLVNRNTYNTGTVSWSYHYYFTAGAAAMTWSSDYEAFELTNNNWYIFGTNYATLALYQVAVAPNDANSTAT